MTLTPERLRQALLAWYDANCRNLPWRADTDPYRVWVSEIMLQQTRVDAVVPYYNRWLATFPDVLSLASAELHDVLKQWEGLGYYARARNLHSAARLVRERYNGRVPDTYETLRELPGIGEYTAGAIASIAYNENRPAVDGNVRRVLSRLFDVAAPTAAAIRHRAAAIVDPDRPGDFNQAIMELGATVCTPRTPSCEECPVRDLCRAYARNTISDRPGRTPRKTIPHEHVQTLLCVNGMQVLVRQRPQHGLLGGMWEFPECRDVPADAVAMGEVTHVFSHKRVTYRAFLTTIAPAVDSARWIPVHELSSYPMPVAQRKLQQLVRAAIGAADAEGPCRNTDKAHY